MSKKVASSKKSSPESSTIKKKYNKPTLKTENLMTFGALCNGTVSGQRKQSTGAPNFCNSSKLLS
ncbi:MAG: hypothetical protein IT287_00790 [Bdellovibrionaceae bacterium]|nr:hypothetical protein [Pseudobdellovibrionaceae bacterium]